MGNNNKNVKSTSFEINKLITVKQIFSKVDLMLSSRLVLRCIVDYWNFKLGYSYPTQKTISLATGLSIVSVVQAVKELQFKQLVYIQKRNKRIYYYFTLNFLNLITLLPKVSLSCNLSSLNNNIQDTLQNNILKEKENTSLFPNPCNDELSEVEFAKIFVTRLGHLPQFKAKAETFKQMYGFD